MRLSKSMNKATVLSFQLLMYAKYTYGVEVAALHVLHSVHALVTSSMTVLVCRLFWEFLMVPFHMDVTVPPLFVAQVRRAAAKCITALLTTRPDLVSDFYAKISPTLINRFKGMGHEFVLISGSKDTKCLTHLGALGLKGVLKCRNLRNNPQHNHCMQSLFFFRLTCWFMVWHCTTSCIQWLE